MINTYISITFRLGLYLAIPMMFGMMGVAPYFIPWFMAKEFSIVGLLIMITSPIILFISISNVFGIQYLLPTGMMKKYSASIVIGAIINLILNIILIPLFGALGACIAIVIAEFSVMFVQWLFVRTSLNLNVRIRNFALYFIGGIIMLVVVSLIGRFNGPGIITNVIQITSGVIVYMSFITLTKDEFHMLMISKIKTLLVRSK